MLGRVFLCGTSTKLGLMCLAQGHNAVMLVRLEPAAVWSQVKHSTTEPLPSLQTCLLHLHLGLPNLHITLRVVKPAYHTQGCQTSISNSGLPDLHITLRVARPPYHTQGCQTYISHKGLPNLHNTELQNLRVAPRVAKPAYHTQGCQTSISHSGLPNLHITQRVAKPTYHTQGC